MNLPISRRPCRCVVYAHLLAFLAASTATFAATSELEEIVVTAQKREQSLQKVPISVSAITVDEIIARSMRNLGDFATEVPGIQITKSDQGGDNAGVYIRGIGQFDWLPTFDPGVGIYVDGVYLARTAGGLLDLTDLNRVEVLRGPQGTLFGKNTIGGAINVTTNSPTFTNEGNAFVRAGERNRIDAGVTLNVPVIDDRLAVRLSLLTKNQDGFGTSLVTGR
jgi:iron complex outermembrane receptor protein